MWEGSLFSTSLPTFLFWVLFDDSHSKCREMTNPWSIISFANIFFHSVGCLSFLPMVSFTVQKLLRLIKGSHLFIFVFLSLASGDSPSLNGQMLKLKLQYFGVIGKDPDAGKDWTQKEKGRRQRMRWLDSITNSMDMNLSQLRETVKGREGWHATAHGAAKSQTQLGEWTTTIYWVPGVCQHLSAKDVVMNKTDEIPALVEFTV